MQTAVLHKGLLEKCRVCNPDLIESDDRKRRRKTKGEVTLDLYVRRQVAQELGEDEPTKDERFVLLQKFGVTAPRIDRQVTRPKWMKESEWKRKLNEWYKATKGLVAQIPPARRPTNHTPWREIRFKNPQAQQRHQQRQRDTRTFRPNSGRGPTVSHPS
jgi:hypothetical protein